MPRFYSKVLNQTLQDLVEDQLGTDPSEQLSLFEELALMRVTCRNAVKLYSAACSTENEETRTNAAELMKDAIRSVADLCERAARVSALQKDKLSVHNLNFLVQQMIAIMWDVCGEDNQAIAELFEERVRSEIRVSSINEGTTITPDQDVTAMDGTIPFVEEDVDG